MTVEYKLTIRTAARLGAGTDSTISVVLVGTRGESGPHTLDKRFHNDFEAGAEDVDTVSSEDVGELVLLRFSNSEGAAGDWLLDTVWVNSGGRSWFFPFHQLQNYPEAEARLATEAASPADAPLSVERLRGAPWSEAVAYEVLRVLPAVRIFLRTPSAETQLAGVTWPAGTTLMISNQHLHRDPSHWANPEVFEPARWLDGGAAMDPLGSGHFFPFGRGPRARVAGAFAMVYLQTALLTITSRARIHVDSTEPFEEGPFFGGVLPKGVTGALRSRQTAHEQPSIRARPSPAAKSA